LYFFFFFVDAPATVYVVVKNSPFSKQPNIVCTLSLKQPIELYVQSDSFDVKSLTWHCDLIYDTPERSLVRKSSKTTFDNFYNLIGDNNDICANDI
jgi:hypothetical protein